MNRNRKLRSPRYQLLETRSLLAGIMFDSTTGIVSVEGSGEDDDLRIEMSSVTEISVDLRGIEEQVFDLGEVTQVMFDALGGDDRFRNDTAVPAVVFGRSGDDDIVGGTGDDELRGGEGEDNIEGGEGDDFIRGDDGDDELDGGPGNDYIVGADGNDRVFGRSGDDTVLGNAGNDQVRGDNGNDRVFGNEGNDEVWGGDGDDLLVGHADDDTLYGDEGNDRIYGFEGNDTIVGGEGDDTVAGGVGDDTLFGNEGDDRIYAFDGDDWVSAGEGDDETSGGDGNDRLLGGDGNDKIWGGNDSDHIAGNLGDDLVVGNSGADKLFGGHGQDTVFGNQGADIINGGSDDDVLVGGDDDDIMFGEDGDDRMYGNGGNDFLNGQNDRDSLFGDAGNDSILGGNGRDFILGHDGDDYLRGQAGNDTVYAGDGNDRLIGDSDDDRLFGQNGDDYLRGDSGNDILLGNAGIDVLDGGEGDDDLYSNSDDHVVEDSDDSDEDDDDYDSTGRPLGLSNRITVSFAPNGTPIFNQTSSLFSAFSSILNPEQVQDSILTAFETWGRHGNLDVGLVDDSGDAFGTSGTPFGDPRFGDVRIGAIPLPGNVNAIAIGQEDFVVGTWAGDILFNSNASFQDAEDFFATALHEVGHVLGLEHTNDVNRAMHRFSNRTTLHAQDIAEFMSIYGTRALDRNDVGASNNDSFDDATDLRFEGDDFLEGEYPAIAFADISETSDLDFFEIRIPDDYNGSATIYVTSETISQLEFKATLYSETEQLLQTKASSDSYGDTVGFDLSTDSKDRFFVKVESKDGQSIGGFSVAAKLDNRSVIDDSEMLIAARDRKLVNFEPDELAEFLADPNSYLIDEDAHANDSSVTATELETRDGFELYSRYEYRASLLDNTDVDFYRFRTVDQPGANKTLNISVRSLAYRGMTPSLKLMDRSGNVIATQVAVNGNGEYAIQLENFQASTEYLVAIESDSLLAFRDGNYELVISHTDSPLAFQQLAAGQFDSTQKKYHSLHVARAQMFQFGLEASPLSGNNSARIWASIYDQNGNAVYQITTRAGERRTSNTVMLLPGSYTIEIEKAQSSVFTNLDYRLIGIDVGDPQGPEFTDPSDSPFDQDEDGDFVFPDDVVVKENFVVVDGISSNQSNPPNDDPPTNLFDWYWGILG